MRDALDCTRRAVDAGPAAIRVGNPLYFAPLDYFATLDGMSQTIRVRLSAFASAAEALGWHVAERRVPAGASLAAVIEILGRECPRLAQAASRLKFAVNQRYAAPDAPLQDGDEVAIIPPVSGGAQPAARLVREAIDLATLVREIEDAGVGALVTFAGVVRYESDAAGRGLRALEYTAYDTMALGEMGRLCDEAARRFAVHRIIAVHRLGLMRIGETSVAVVASAPHRGDAFDAARFLIDELKRAVPIFKREVWTDGHANWVDGI